VLVDKKGALKWIDEKEVEQQIPDSIFERDYKYQSINSSVNKG